MKLRPTLPGQFRSPDPPSVDDRLESWKDIARFLKRDIRTVQRWESEGMPVYRHQHTKRASVYALRSELDAWWRERSANLQKESSRGKRGGLSNSLAFRVSWYLRFAVYAFIALVIYLALGEARRLIPSNSFDTATAGRPLTLSVLPFQSASSQPDDRLLAEGLTIQVVSDLEKSPAIRVTSPASTMLFFDSDQTPVQIARELGSDEIIQGKLVRVGAQLQITSEMIDAQTGRQVWSNHFTGDSADLLSLKSDFAGAIANQVHSTLLPGHSTPELSPHHEDPEARLEYLKGRHALADRTPAGLQQSIEDFQSAVRRDPNYAQAYSGLADSYFLLTVWSSSSPSDTLREARDAATKAVELDPDLAAAHVSLAVIAFHYDWDPSTAEREFREALRINPSSETAHHAYGNMLASLGRFDQGIDELKQAEALSPFSEIIRSDLGVIYFFDHQNARALAQLHALLHSDPNCVPALLGLGLILESTRDYSGAYAAYQKLASVTHNQQVLTDFLPLLDFQKGKISQARRAIAHNLRNSHGERDAQFRAAILYSEIGDKEEALRCLEKSLAERSARMESIAIYPAFVSLHADPRFKAIERRVHLIP